MGNTTAASTSSLLRREVEPGALKIDLGALQPFLAAHGPVAVIDLETTGLPSEGDVEILEFGCVLLDPASDRVESVESLVRPSGSVPRAVRALTGITDADVADAPSIQTLAPEVDALLAGRVLIAHNADFELHFLERFVSPRFRDQTFLDTQDLLAVTHPDAADLRLETFTRGLLEREERHRALADATDTACLIARVASGASSGELRYGVARDALEVYGPQSPWLPLLSAQGLPMESGLPSQYIRVPETGEAPVPFDADAICEALADEGRGRRYFPGYRVREPQLRMAREFVALLSEGGRLLLEGGTGVGKSLAYLAAAIPFAIEQAAGGIREPVVISTRTKLLQDQLLGKDIPAAAALLGYPELRALSIKGRANYVCRRRCDQLLARGRDPQLFAEDRLAYAVLAASARLRAHGEIGTLPGALLVRYPQLRNLRGQSVAARSEQCTREQCASERSCPFGRRRAALSDAHLVVANHDLLLRWPPDYPRFTHVVADEAHELPGVADEAYALEVRPDEILERLEELFGRGASAGALPVPAGFEPNGARGDLRREFGAVGAGVGEHASEYGEVQLPAGAAELFREPAQLAKTASERIDFIVSLADQELAKLPEEAAQRELAQRACADLRDAASTLRSAFEEDDDSVASFQGLFTPWERWSLVVRRVETAEVFHDSFLSRLESLACVSASLFVGGSAEAALGGLEIESRSEAPAWRVEVASPFPYQDHMRVVALDAPGDPVARTSDALEALARRLDGRCLGLFTSLRRMREVRDRLWDALHGEGFDLLVPRRATDDPAALVERFRRAGSGGVLLGARTFWQGLDIPGDALQAVVIEKLPFEVPTELRKRRDLRLRAQGLDAFETQTLGSMLLNLKQMVGRLIRSETDRGIVVIVDARPERRYFERLGEALPQGCEVTRATLPDLERLLEEVGVIVPPG